MTETLLGNPTAVESLLQATWKIPLWLVLVLALLAAGLAVGLYFSERGRAGKPIRWLLAAVRFTLLMLVLWMLAGWSWLRFKSDRPELVVVVDRSASMSTRDVGQDSSSPKSSRLERAIDIFSQLSNRERQRLRGQYQLQWYTLAETLEPLEPAPQSEPWVLPVGSADGTQSRLGDGLLRLLERQAGRGTAAVVFVSDGITTSGAALSDVAKSARRGAVPVYTVTLGRPYELPDLRLADLLIDRDVYLGDQVTAEVAVVVSDVPAAETRIALRDMATGKILDETRWQSVPGQSQSSVRLSFVPERAGELSLRIEAAPMQGEQELANNQLDTVVHVQDKTIRVLLVSAVPSYEYRFLKSFLERATQVGAQSTASFEVHTVLQDADPLFVDQDKSALRLVPSSPERILQYDAFVLVDIDPQLISQISQQAIYRAVAERGSGCIFIDGSGSQVKKLDGWPLGQLLPVARGELSPMDSQPLPLGQLSWQPTNLGRTALPMQMAATLTESLNIWSKLPDFASLGQVDQVKPGAQVLGQATDRQSGQTAPLLITQFAGAGRVALQATDETYRWSSYLSSDLYYQRYWGQMLRWLSRGKLSGNGKTIELLVEPKQANFGQAIRFQVTLGSDASSSAAESAVEVSIEGSQGRRESLPLSRVGQTTDVYQASRNDLIPGTYRAVVARPLADSPASEDFTVTAPPGEQASLRANVEGMQQLAEQSRGRHYLESQVSQLFQQLPPGKSTRLGGLPSIPMWNSWWVAVLFVGLISLEWILRRRYQML